MSRFLPPAALLLIIMPIAGADSLSPGARYGHELIYDAAREEVVLFGGFDSSGVPKGDTWIWNGESWRLAARTGPSPRKWPAAAYDSKRGLIVLHGGREGVGRTGQSMSDTWIWDGQRWTEVAVAGPTGKDHHRAAYDKARDRIVLFGGWNGEGLDGDTWEFDGSDWRQVATTGPSPRAPFGMAYDIASQSVVLTGGQNLEGAFADIWSWDGAAWTQLDIEIPSPRGFHAMAYDSANKSLILFGGRNGDRLLNGLWRWQDDQWIQLSDDGPLRRGIYASVYDAAHKEFLFHGSGDRVDGNWELSAETWAWSPESGWILKTESGHGE